MVPHYITRSVEKEPEVRDEIKLEKIEKEEGKWYLKQNRMG